MSTWFWAVGAFVAGFVAVVAATSVPQVGPYVVAPLAALAVGGVFAYAYAQAAGATLGRAAAVGAIAGALLVWAALMGLIAAHTAGASYLFTWPLLFSLLGLGWTLVGPRAGAQVWWRVAILTLAAARASSWSRSPRRSSPG
jgi:hypothetical protein